MLLSMLAKEAKNMLYKFETIENIPHIKIYEDKYSIDYLTVYENEFNEKIFAIKRIRKSDSNVFLPWNSSNTKLNNVNDINILYDAIAHLLLASENFDAAKTFINEEKYNESGDGEDPESEFIIFIEEVEKYLK